MRVDGACIPVGFAWSSPFVRWQGSLSEVSSIDVATSLTRRALDDRGLDPGELDRIVYGWTVPQEGIFYGAPTLAARIGAERISGPMVSQACATSVAVLQVAALEQQAAGDGLVLAVTADRTSNGPHIVYPAPSRAGGQPRTEDWVMDNFRRDPWAGKPMVDTAESVAREGGVTREEIDEVACLRYEQYQTALADDRAFQRRYMVAVEVPRRRGEPLLVVEDEGIYPTTAEGLAKLPPVDPDGVITYGSQTHPADGAAGMVVSTEARARALSAGEGIARVLATGFARVEAGRMPKAPVPAALAALEAADLDVRDIDAVTTHNPFAVNDIWLSRQTGLPLEQMNARGSSLIYGHPQAPTGARLIAELIQVLHQRGGGIGLFTGCAAGDTGGAVVLRVED
jgi:acetyl-CoA acetyltransferase family protein